MQDVKLSGQKPLLHLKHKYDQTLTFVNDKHMNLTNYLISFVINMLKNTSIE